jgi:ribosome biogenesis protein SSF1/2
MPALPHRALHLVTPPPPPAPSPPTARWNTVKDYVHVAAQYGLTHVWTVTQTDAHVHLRVMRLPHGPTLTFRVREYTNARLVRAVQKMRVDPAEALEHSPLVVMHGFNTVPPDGRPASLAGISRPDAMKLVSSMWQHMFPQIQPGKVRLADCRRVVLMHLVPDTGDVEFRHYYIRAVPVGLSRSAATLLKGRVPDLGGYADISEFMAARGRASSATAAATGGAGGSGTAPTSDSEGEGDAAAATVTLAQDFRGAGNKAAGRSAVKLTEIGPRMTLQLVKVEKGLGGGEVLYHAFQQRTREEAEALERAAAERAAARELRKERQAANVARKAEAAAAKKAAKAERKAARQEAAKRAAAAGTLAGDGEDTEEDASDASSEEDEEEGVEDDDEEEGVEVEGEEEDEGAGGSDQSWSDGGGSGADDTDSDSDGDDEGDGGDAGGNGAAAPAVTHGPAVGAKRPRPASSAAPAAEADSDDGGDGDEESGSEGGDAPPAPPTTRSARTGGARAGGTGGVQPAGKRARAGAAADVGVGGGAARQPAGRGARGRGGGGRR